LPPLDRELTRTVSLQGLWLTGNSSLEAAIGWLADHGEDADIDEPLMVAPEKEGSKLSKEEQQKLLEEKLAKLRAEKAHQDKEMEKLQEINRIQSMKELTEARKKQQEQEEKIAEEKRRREKEWDAKERARVKAELEKDRAGEKSWSSCCPSPVITLSVYITLSPFSLARRLETLCCMPSGIALVVCRCMRLISGRLRDMTRMMMIFAERMAKAGKQPTQTAKPEDPHKGRKIELGSKLRDLIFALRNDPATPNPANKVIVM